MPTLTLTHDEFIKAHGGHPLRIVSRGGRFLPDGCAVLDPWPGAMDNKRIFVTLEGRREFDILTARKIYQEEMIDRLQHARNILRQGLRGNMTESFRWDDNAFGPQPEGDAKTVARRLMELLTQHNATLKAIQAEIDALPEIRKQRELAESLRRAEEEARQRNDAERIALDTILSGEG